jgi:hypothetical protein
MGYFTRLKYKLSFYFLTRWERKGRFPMWALKFFPYLHWCSGMDDMLVDNPCDCFCDYIPEIIKERERAKNYKSVEGKDIDIGL